MKKGNIVSRLMAKYEADKDILKKPDPNDDHLDLPNKADNSLNEQYITKNNSPENKRRSPIEIVSWVVAILSGLAVLYDFIRKYNIIKF